MTKTEKIMAEMSIVLLLPESLIPKIKPGRLKIQMQKLSVLINSELSKMPKMTEEVETLLGKKITVWGKKTRWYGNEKHIASVVSFMLKIIENSGHEYDNEIFVTLNNVF